MTDFDVVLISRPMKLWGMLFVVTFYDHLHSWSLAIQYMGMPISASSTSNTAISVQTRRVCFPMLNDNVEAYFSFCSHTQIIYLSSKWCVRKTVILPHIFSGIRSTWTWFLFHQKNISQKLVNDSSTLFSTSTKHCRRNERETESPKTCLFTCVAIQTPTKELCRENKVVQYHWHSLTHIACRSVPLSNIETGSAKVSENTRKIIESRTN